MRLFFLSTAAITTIAMIACGESNPEPVYPGGYGGGYGTGGYTYGTGGYTQGTGGQTASTYAQAIPPAAAIVVTPMLNGLALTEAQGMSPDGATLMATFQQGQIYEQPITIQPGKCYTVLGVGLNMTELDIELVIHQPPAPEYVAAKDQTTGAQAVLGKLPDCFKNPAPLGLPAKIRLRATAGSGIGVAQAYAK